MVCHTWGVCTPKEIYTAYHQWNENVGFLFLVTVLWRVLTSSAKSQPTPLLDSGHWQMKEQKTAFEY